MLMRQGIGRPATTPQRSNLLVGQDLTRMTTRSAAHKAAREAQSLLQTSPVHEEDEEEEVML